MSNVAPDTLKRETLLAAITARARARTLSLAELFDIAEAMKRAGRESDAVEVYKAWVAYNADHPLLHMAYFNYSVALRANDDLTGSIAALRAAVAARPAFGPARINLGRALEDSGLVPQAIEEWRALAEANAGVTAEQRVRQ